MARIYAYSPRENSKIPDTCGRSNTFLYIEVVQYYLERSCCGRLMSTYAEPKAPQCYTCVPPIKPFLIIDLPMIETHKITSQDDDITWKIFRVGLLVGTAVMITPPPVEKVRAAVNIRREIFVEPPLPLAEQERVIGGSGRTLLWGQFSGLLRTRGSPV